MAELTEYQIKKIDAYRAALEIVKLKPDLLPQVSGGVVSLYTFTEQAMKETRQLLGGGKWDKVYDDSFVEYFKFVNGVKLRVLVTRNAVCERVETGSEEKQVTVNGCPTHLVALDEDGSCPESECTYHTPVEVETVKTVPTYAWDCF